MPPKKPALTPVRTFRPVALPASCMIGLVVVDADCPPALTPVLDLQARGLAGVAGRGLVVVERYAAGLVAGADLQARGLVGCRGSARRCGSQ